MCKRVKADYAIDAPSVITTLAVVGLIGLAVAVILTYYLSSLFPTVVHITVGFIYVGSIICFLEVILMFYSSLYGKLRVRDQLIEALELKGDEIVLDLGCGRGLLMIAAAKKLSLPARAYGLDIWRTRDLSNNQAAMTLRNAKIEQVDDRVELETGDMSKMTFNDNMFDVVVSSLAIHNLPTQKARREVIKEIHRVLKPGGKIALLDFQYVKEYKESLLNLGWKNIICSRRMFNMFPPVIIIMASKPTELV